MMERMSNLINPLRRQHVAVQEATCGELSRGGESSSNSRLGFEDRLKEAIELRRNARKQSHRTQFQGTNQNQELQIERSQARGVQVEKEEFREEKSKLDSLRSKFHQICATRLPLAVCKSEPVKEATWSYKSDASPRRAHQSSPALGQRRRERRGSRFEKVSIKLNRLLESSISMLPRDQSSTTATVGRYQNYSIDGQKQFGRFAAESNDAFGRHKKRMANEEEEDEDDRDVDGGYAWIILAVMFVINASTFGTARAYGLIFDKLARVDEQTRGQAALPFTVMGAIENMAGPLSGCLLAHTTISWRLTVFTGSCLVTLAHLFAALTPIDSPIGQLLSMGLMCGLGLSFVSISFFQVNNAYFIRYRNTAFGVGMTGAAFGTLYISPMCQYALDNYEGTRMCYLMLAFIIAPNVPLSLLLKPKRAPADSEPSDEINERQQQVRTISQEVQRRRQSQASSQQPAGFLSSVKLVVTQPVFHLIWPTQLLFCWFNFVFGMIMVDFGKDRGLNTQDVAHLVPVWAFGQLVGRLVLSTLVDLKFLSYRAFTIICFGVISLTTYILNNSKFTQNQQQNQLGLWFPVSTTTTIIQSETQRHLAILSLVFVLSMFIALLYILLNGLIVSHVEKPLQPLSIGISSFLGSFFLLPRAYAIGYYRDTIGNYDSMLSMFTFVSLCAALTWLIVPTGCKYLKKLQNKLKLSAGRRLTTRSRRQIFTISTPHSTWKLAKDANCRPQEAPPSNLQ